MCYPATVSYTCHVRSPQKDLKYSTLARDFKCVITFYFTPKPQGIGHVSSVQKARPHTICKERQCCQLPGSMESFENFPQVVLKTSASQFESLPQYSISGFSMNVMPQVMCLLSLPTRRNPEKSVAHLPGYQSFTCLSGGQDSWAPIRR